MKMPKLSFVTLVLFSNALTLTGIACSPGPAPVASSSRDPSSPSAPEGVSPLAPPASSRGALHDDAAHEGATFVCPMHPEVTASEPGLCPKCNMHLVPKK